MSDPRGFAPWKHDEDEFDRQAAEDARPSDWLDDADDADFDQWFMDRD